MPLRQPAYYTQRKRKHAELREEIRDTISELKGWTCWRCRMEVDDQKKLHFHHRDGEEKLFNVSHAIRMRTPILKLIAEIRKCDVLCIYCHNTEHGG